MQLPEAWAGDADRYYLHPAAFDACLQVLAAALPGYNPADETAEIYMPIGIDRFEVHGRGGSGLTFRLYGL